MELPEWPPSHDELLETDDGPRRLAGYLVRRQTDRANASAEQETAVIDVQFKHSAGDSAVTPAFRHLAQIRG